MTIPSVISKVTGSTTTATLVQKIILPENIQNGNMLVVSLGLRTQAGTTTETWDNATAGTFTDVLAYNRGLLRHVIYWKIADGTESSLTLSIVTSVSAGGAWVSFCIDSHNSLIETTVTGAGTGNTSPGVGLTPTWGAKDVLWISGYTGPGSNILAPSGYSSTYTVAGSGSTRVGLTTIEKGISNTISESLAPSSWGINLISAAENQIVYLLGIQGAAAGGFTITSVNEGNDVYSGQTFVKVVGTGLSNVTSATYKGAACSEISKSSSLSITMTFPNFFTNNIKVGAQHSLKVRG